MGDTSDLAALCAERGPPVVRAAAARAAVAAAAHAAAAVLAWRLPRRGRARQLG
jgi:hypothetical protein